MNPNYNQKQHEGFVEEQIKSPYYRNNEFMIKIREIFENTIFNNVGVLSLTGVQPDEYLMWHKYSMAFHGIRIGYNSSKLFKFLMGKGFGGGIVKYEETLPEILPSPFMVCT